MRILSNSCTYDTIDTLYTDNHQNKYWRRLTKFYIPPLTPTDSILELIRYEEADEYTCHYDEPYIEVWKIYNLEDTTSIKKGELGKGLYCRDSDIDSFVEVTSTFDIIKHEKAYWTYRLTVTDSLLSLMQKDTSMLRLFPDYYGGE
ncbi:MAG: hypothetical protein K5650_04665 [Bacteroidales bacterium]|nr:hypothetical protein [Bacteroidales bacterium]